jgi:MFS family permease
MSTAPTTAPARQQYGRLISTEQLKLLFIMLFGLSGASALIYEIAWVRLLSLAFGVSVYAVSIVVSTFMGGLALGSWLFGRLLRELRTKTQEPILEQSNKATKQQSTSIHIENITLSTDHQVTLPSNGQPPATSHQPRRLLRLYAALQFGVALFALLSPLLFRQISGLYAQIDQAGALSPIATAALRFGLAALILLVPTVLMGGTLPLAAQLLAQRTSERGSVLGALYASNTLGAVCGTAMAGVVLIRLFGTQATILIAAAGDLLVAGVAIGLSSQSIEQLQEQRAQVSGRRKPKREKRKTQDPRPKTQDPGPNDLQRSATVRNTDDGRRATNIQSPIATSRTPTLPPLCSPALPSQASPRLATR